MVVEQVQARQPDQLLPGHVLLRPLSKVRTQKIYQSPAYKCSATDIYVLPGHVLLHPDECLHEQ